jgi:hypothetical protein
MRTGHLVGTSATVFAVALACATAALADPAPTPTPTAAPAGVSDPCTSMSSLVSRPSFSTAACAVKPHDLLLETGYTNTTASGHGGASTISFPQASMRVGIGRNLEFDLDPASYERTSTVPKISGLSDTSLGLKYEFGYTSRFVYGVNALVTTNSGSAAFSGNGAGLLANLNAAFTVSPAVGLFATVGYNAQSAGTVTVPARFNGIDPSLGASVSLPQGFIAYVEGFGQSSTGPGLGGRYGVDGGFQKDVGSRLQLDINYYDFLGIQGGMHLHSIGFGAAYLIGS